MRTLLIFFLVLAVPVALGACGVVRGDKEVDTDPAEGAIGKGSGMVTGKRGGLVIYQK